MKNNLKLLYNPFERIAGWQAFGIGLVFVFASVAIAFSFDTVFRGVFNLSPLGDGNILTAILSQSIALLITYVVFYVSGCLFAKGVRLQDIVGVFTLARFPFIFMSFSGYFLTAKSQQEILDMLSQQAQDGTSNAIAGEIMTMIIISLVMLCIIVWYVALLWNAFKVSTGITHKYRVLIFILALIIADVLARLTTSFLL